MRQLRLLAVVVATVAGVAIHAAPSAHAQTAHCWDVFGLNGQATIFCDDSGGGPSVDPVGTGPDAPAPVPQWNFVFGPEGVYCIARTGWMDVTGLSPDAIENLRAFADNTYNAMLLYNFEPCPGVDAPLTPTAWALQYVRAIELPVPLPEIEPGKMLVGLEAFLETGSPRTHVIDDTSPFGPVHVELISEVRVLWGDGATTDWTTAPDGPYPDGEVTHVWTRQGAYDVTVTQRWVASWSVGGQSGSVRDGLTSEGTLAAFPVEEIEAVIVG